MLRLSVDFYFDQVLNPPESQLIGSNQSCDLFGLDQINSIIWPLRATDVLLDLGVIFKEVCFDIPIVGHS